MTDEEKLDLAIDWIRSQGWNEENLPSDELLQMEKAFLAGLKAGNPKWHKLDWKKNFPDVDRLIRVRTRSGAEYICETYSYEPAEDEIGYGSVITQFSELNGDWVDDNEVEYWCEIEPFKE